MKVLHAIGWYFPESSGGTEVYVEGLTRHLFAQGIESEVLVAREGGVDRWNGVPLRYFGERAQDDATLDRFRDVLRASAADVFHQHSWTPGCGPDHLRVASEAGLKTVVTIHVPGVVCPRGTMMLDGERACNGQINVARCTRCWGASRGIPDSLTVWQGRFPKTSSSLGRLLQPTRLGTALSTPRLVRERHADLMGLARRADRVVAVCRWLYDALVLNGLPTEKLVYSAQGVDVGVTPHRGTKARTGALRIGYLGRWDPVKGIHVIVEAFRQLPRSVPAELVIHGLPFDDEYERRVRERAAGDERITMAAPVPRPELSSALASFDLIAVPSLWLETGPLVVLEAFAAGTPVIGSLLGGIGELVPNGYGNVLLPAGDVAAWTAAIEQCATTRYEGVPPPLPRSIAAVASEMAAVYDAITRPESLVARVAYAGAR